MNGWRGLFGAHRSTSIAQSTAAAAQHIAAPSMSSLRGIAVLRADDPEVVAKVLDQACPEQAVEVG